MTDEKNEPLIGLTVMVKNSTVSTATSVDGSYSISAAPGDVLVFSYIGYQAQQLTVGNQTSLNVTMKTDAKTLEEVVVVGYATQKKANLTGAVSTVSAEKIENRPVTNVSSALAGTAPGLMVSQSSGQPGSDGAVLRIRGVGTFNNSSPLVLVDGIIGDMNSVNPNDVESISVLKDASSASIYGAQAAPLRDLSISNSLNLCCG